MALARRDDLRTWLADVGWLYVLVALIAAVTVIFSVGWGTIRVFLLNTAEVVAPRTETLQAE